MTCLGFPIHRTSTAGSRNGSVPLTARILGGKIECEGHSPGNWKDTELSKLESWLENPGH